MAGEGGAGDEGKTTRRREAALFGILVLLGLGAGVGARVWTAGRVGDGAIVAGTAFNGAKLSPAAAAMWSRLLEALGTQGERPLTIARLIQLLSGHLDDPLAQAFVEDFKRDPRLMALWDQWLHAQDVLYPSWLHRELSERPSFAELLNKYSADPRFSALGDTIGGEIKAATARKPAGPVAVADAQLRRGPVEGKETVKPAGEVAAGPRSQGPGRDNTVEGGPDAGDAPGDRGPGDIRQLRPGAQPGAHEALKLKAVTPAGPDMDVTRFLASMFADMDKDKRDKLIALCLEREICDPVAACETAQLYGDCLAACNRNPKCAGRIPPVPPSVVPLGEPSVVPSGGPSGTNAAVDSYGGCGSEGSWRECSSAKDGRGCQMCSNGRWGICSTIPEQQSHCGQ